MTLNELYHHGILGQKWGQKNGPPYPLDSGDHSAAEKKAGWRKSLDNSSSEDKGTVKVAISKKLAKEIKRDYKLYEKISAKLVKEENEAYRDLYLKAYNATADEYNNGKIDDFNRRHEGLWKTDPDKYEELYLEEFSNDFERKFIEDRYQFVMNNKNYQKGKALIEKYGDELMSDVMRTDKEFYDALGDAIEKVKPIAELERILDDYN